MSSVFSRERTCSEKSTFANSSDAEKRFSWRVPIDAIRERLYFSLGQGFGPPLSFLVRQSEVLDCHSTAPPVATILPTSLVGTLEVTI